MQTRKFFGVAMAVWTASSEPVEAKAVPSQQSAFLTLRTGFVCRYLLVP